MPNKILAKDVHNTYQQYEALLSSLNIVKNLLRCDHNGKFVKGPAYDILKELFDSGNDGCKPNMWFDVHTTCNDELCYYSCFEDRIIRYYNKKCRSKKTLWKPEITACIENALDIIREKIDSCPCTFREIMDLLVLYLMCSIECIEFDEIVIIMIAMCDLLKQVIYYDRIVKKSAATICD